ncbi:MAG: DUF2683 family protein [Candidatus Aenigmarchaeota archaeon]|nr:DUF2683 family protein [Candidatus Aenigmarchaeota archaeon]
MVKAIIDIDEHANRIINVIKAKYGLQDKSQAINTMARQYEEEVMEPELRPEYIEKLKKIEKQPARKVKNFAKEFGLQ